MVQGKNPPDRIDCVKCGAPLDMRDRIRDPAANKLRGRIGPVRPTDLLASGQRVWGVRRFFEASAIAGMPRILDGIALYPPELMNAPMYNLAVDLQVPDRGPLPGANDQPVPAEWVPILADPQAAGRVQLVCAINPDLPFTFWVVDWRATPAPPPAPPPRSNRWFRRN